MHCCACLFYLRLCAFAQSKPIGRPSKYLETYGIALSLEADDGSKAKKLKEYLLSDEMTALLRSQEPPLKIVLTKAGHDRRYTVESLNEQWQ